MIRYLIFILSNASFEQSSFKPITHLAQVWVRLISLRTIRISASIYAATEMLAKMTSLGTRQMNQQQW